MEAATGKYKQPLRKTHFLLLPADFHKTKMETLLSECVLEFFAAPPSISFIDF